MMFSLIKRVTSDQKCVVESCDKVHGIKKDFMSLKDRFAVFSDSDLFQGTFTADDLHLWPSILTIMGRWDFLVEPNQHAANIGPSLIYWYQRIRCLKCTQKNQNETL